MSISDKDRDFLNLLQKEPLRIENRRACDRPEELEDDEMKVILSLSGSVNLEEACNILRPLYQQYKGGVGKRVMPELIIRGIYFIIFREMSKLLLEDKERCKKERKWLSDESDGKLRNRILTDCTNRVYKLLGEKSSKVQERFGIQPLRDFTMLYYEPVGFHIRPSKKDEWFRALFLNIVYHADYAMFIDLTGDDTIFGDIYYGKREVVCCHDSVTANFYYAMQDTILREKEELRIECIRNGMTDAETEAKLKAHEKNKEKRTKRGFLFFDYNVQHSDEDAKEFFQFIKRNDCRWAFVCDRTESYWLKRLAEVSPYKIAVDMENPYSNYVHIRGYCDIVIITNVEVRGIMIEPIKRMLGAFDISDEKLINSLITKEILTETE